eukprot:PhF_6_TR34169/c0_g1_i3/m.49986
MWSDTPTSGGIVKKAGVLFEEHSLHRSWAGLFNLVVCVFQGILSGLPVEGNERHCGVMYAGTVLLYIVVIVCQVCYASYHTSRDRITFIGVAVMLVVGNGARTMRYLAPSTIDTELEKLIVFVCMIVGTVFNVVCIVLFVVGSVVHPSGESSSTTTHDSEDHDKVQSFDGEKTKRFFDIGEAIRNDNASYL